MTRDAHEFLARLDALLARAEQVKAHLALYGGPLFLHVTHAGMADEIRQFREDFRRAMEPESPPGATPDHPAMWAAPPGADATPIAADAVADDEDKD